MPFICLPSHHPSSYCLGPFSLSCWYDPLYAPVMLSVFCALCHGEYPYLTQLIRPFILMEFSLMLAEACVFSQWDRAVCSGRGWSWETDCLKQKCCVWQALCSHSLPLSNPRGCTARNVHWLRLWEGKNNYFAKIIVSMHDFLVIQFNYIDKQPLCRSDWSLI